MTTFHLILLCVLAGFTIGVMWPRPARVICSDLECADCLHKGDKLEAGGQVVGFWDGSQWVRVK